MKASITEKAVQYMNSLFKLNKTELITNQSSVAPSARRVE